MNKIRVHIQKENGNVTSIHIYSGDLQNFIQIINEYLCACEIEINLFKYEDEIRALNDIAEEAKGETL